MKRIVLLLLVLISFVDAKATHIMGGEITWVCIDDPLSPDLGKYIFKMKLYYDCDGVPGSTFAQSLDVWGNTLVTSISLAYLGKTDISPQCNVVNSGFPALDCITNPVGAVEEFLYESQPIVLTGSPPISGWHFTWNTCCRNGAITNLVITDVVNPKEGFTLRASMFPYFDAFGNALPVDPCFDNSPKFNESPKTIICTGYPFSYSHNASDAELDSIVYSWDQPLDEPNSGSATNSPNISIGQPWNPGINGNPISIPFNAPYVFNAPIPGGVTLDPQTGEISYNSPISGYFVSVIRIDAYKCGQKTASIYREIQAVLIACDTLPNGGINLPPVVTPPFPMPTPFYSTVSAGDLVSFNISATDSDLYLNGSGQDLTLEISGGQVADDYITNTMCDNPPCATFTNAFNQPPPIFGAQIVEGFFEWQTACSHVATDNGCGNTSNIYTFVVKAYDDFCPANGITVATITIEVTAADSLPATEIECAWESSNGDVTFNWNTPTGASSSTVYHIYGAVNIGGPYTVLSDVSYPLESEIIPATSLVGGIKYFHITSESTCAENSVPSDTISALNFGVTHDDVSCWDDTDGSIQVVVEDYINVLSYQFSLDGVLNTNSHPLDTFWNNVSSGSHVINVIDTVSGCTLDVPIIISAPEFPLQALASSEVSVCAGGSSGFLVGSSAGGTPGYIYSWYESGNPVSFSSNDTVVDLSAGSYYLSVEDANGCDTFTTVNIIEPQFALEGSVQVFAVPCKGDSTGMLVGDAGGGWGPYVYYWLDSQGDTLQSSSSYVSDRDTLFNLPSGVYQLHIYDSKLCFVNYFLNVSEPAVALSIDSILLVEGIACYGDSVGKAILYASGGQANYTYSWDNGENSTIAFGLTSGDHSVTLSDVWGCEVLESIYIPENSLIESDLLVDQDVLCYGETNGIASISSVGGSSIDYTYFWSQGQQTIGVNSDTAFGLLQGSYYVTTRDVLGCEVVDSIYISEPDPLSMEAFELDRVDCYNSDDGFAGATATGGISPYSYSWGAGVLGDTVNTLTAGLYTVIVTDDNECTSSDTVEIHSPDSLYINIDDSLTILPYCIGVNSASLSANAYGGTLDYTYEWDDNVNLPQTTTTATALLAGIYTITVTDSKGCTASDTRDIDTITNTMDMEVVSLTQYVGGNDISCFGYNDGEAIASISGPYGPYTYQWFGGSSATTATISNLYAGTYSVIVRDANNCMVNGSVNLTEPSSLTFSTSTNILESCLGACDGKILIDTLSGGFASYTGFLTDNMTGVVSTHSVVSNYILGVCSGSYTVSLIDANDCPSTVISGGQDQQFINYGAQTQAQINTITAVDVICNDSSGVLSVLDLNTSMGYSYSWHDLLGDTVSTDNPAINLPAGVYVLHASYNNTIGCTTYDTLEIIEYSAITNSVTIEDVLCYGDSNGVITALAGSAGSSYTYSWNTNPVQNTPQATGLSTGNYVCTVTDNNGCVNEFIYSVNEPDPIEILIDITNVYTLNVTGLSGGLPPYTYEWFEQLNSSQVLNSTLSYTVSANGSYYVSVTDANGCVDYSSVTSFGTTSLSDLSIVALSIYPNPFKDETTVDFGREIKQASVRVVDMFGKLIEEHSVINTDKYILKRENKASGIYFVEIEVEQKEKAIYKLIIE